MEIKKVDHIGIAGSDLESAKGFYTKTLGLMLDVKRLWMA